MDKVRWTVWIRPEMKKKAKAMASLRGITIGEFLEGLIALEENHQEDLEAIRQHGSVKQRKELQELQARIDEDMVTRAQKGVGAGYSGMRSELKKHLDGLDVGVTPEDPELTGGKSEDELDWDAATASQQKAMSSQVKISDLDEKDDEELRKLSPSLDDMEFMEEDDG